MKHEVNRRRFLLTGSFGLAALGVSGGSWTLRADAGPTVASGELGDYAAYLDAKPTPGDKRKTGPTEDNILGPFYRAGAPYRAKITPPLAEGTVLLVRGRVWGHDTRKPLPGAVLDIWQANAHGRYDNDDRNHPPTESVFQYRARLLTDENGFYEFETIHPGRYQIGRNVWRPSHIHYLVRSPGYRQLVTQLYFKDDPMNEKDDFIKDSLVIELSQRKSMTGMMYEEGTFDIVLAKD